MRGLVIPALLEQMKHLTGSDARNVSAGQRGVTDSVDEAGEAHGVECGGKSGKAQRCRTFGSEGQELSDLQHLWVDIFIGL